MKTESNFLIKEENVFCGALSCRGCGWSLLVRHISNVMGTKTVYVVPACCFSIIAGPYPMNMLKGTVVHTLFAAAAATATGVRHSLDRQGKKKSAVVVLAGDGGTFDIGLQSLSGAAARNENILYICNNNGAYMNTGVQSSTATPMGAITTTNPSGKTSNAKDLMGIIAAHKIPYFATASLAFLDDLKKKLEKAKSLSGFRFLMIDSPCPPGHKYAPEMSIEISRLAVETNYFPLFEAEDGDYEITHFPKKKIAVSELFKQQGRFSHLFKTDATKLMNSYQKEVDTEWEALLEKVEK
ncbi:MAG: thiamine pyrophosphate-dependent enzyme [Bacteroidetes bacterium]|jgi:pyruvate/2-oxoacid:ferredoxin oxidoreductase beta subunit|nr:thiamine pyrophosphate-dependent enzyme [Bacteroidota bacterium]